MVGEQLNHQERAVHFILPKFVPLRISAKGEKKQLEGMISFLNRNQLYFLSFILYYYIYIFI